jgi:aryl-alcohol dehydrogenase-like predicted oxidoreductase
MEREEDHMEYTKLGNTGMDVSRICLGCMGFGDPQRWIHKWVLNEENSRPIIKKALGLGINFFDTANVYSIGKSEEILGRALKDFANRDEVVIATKVHGRMHDGPNGAGLSRKAILSEIDKSLKRLGTDYVDLYQIHRWDRPSASPSVPAAGGKGRPTCSPCRRRGPHRNRRPGSESPPASRSSKPRRRLGSRSRS